MYIFCLASHSVFPLYGRNGLGLCGFAIFRHVKNDLYLALVEKGGLDATHMAFASFKPHKTQKILKTIQIQCVFLMGQMDTTPGLCGFTMLHHVGNDPRFTLVENGGLDLPHMAFDS